MLVLASIDRKIMFLSEPYCGSVHDYSMLQQEFDPEVGLWFDEQGVHVDLGFLGIKKDYQAEHVLIPYKRPRRKSKNDPKIELTQEQKDYNKEVSKVRIRVEHSIGGLKRYRFLSDRLRCRDADYYSIVAGVAAGLWNFQLKA